MTLRNRLAVILAVLAAGWLAGSATGCASRVEGEALDPAQVQLVKLVTREAELVLSWPELERLAERNGSTQTRSTGSRSTLVVELDPPLTAWALGGSGAVRLTIGRLVHLGPLHQANPEAQLFALPGDRVGHAAIAFTSPSVVRMEGDSANGSIEFTPTPGAPIRLEGSVPDCEVDSDATARTRRQTPSGWLTDSELWCDMLGLQGY